MAAALAKGTVAAIAGGFGSFLCCRKAELPSHVTVPAVMLGTISSFVYYVRVWIQGYYFDRRCMINPDLTGKVAIVTGGTLGGLGFAGARILAELGATVVITVRSEGKGKQAVVELKRAAGHERISFVIIDFMSKKSVRDGAVAILATHARLDMLVLNAGVGSGKPADVWMANQVGPFLFTELLAPLLSSTAKTYGEVRVVAVSSGAHKKAAIQYDDPYNTEDKLFGGSYGQSKLAQIMHMRELQRRLRTQPGLEGEQAVRCIPVTPGFALTNITAGKIPSAMMPLLWFLSRTPHIGAQVIKMACVDPGVPGGSYLSNCYVKATEGVNGCSNQPGEWLKLWAACEKCLGDDRYA